jgi:hypothetical protein
LRRISEKESSLMINLSCAACGQTVAVESMLAAADASCAHCGKTIIGGRDPNPALLQGPATSLSPENSQRRSSSGGGSVAVTALAIVTLLYGVLSVCAGLGVGWVMTLLKDPKAIAEMRRGGLSEEQLAQVMDISKYVVVLVGGLIILGLALLVAGYGLLRRDSFSRYLTMGLGGLYGVVALLGLLNLEICPTIVNGGYCILVFAVLVNAGDEFRQ